MSPAHRADPGPRPASARSLARLIIDDSEVLALRSFELDDAGTGRLVAQPAGSLATRVSTS
ncbi:hypothetical protein ACTXG6_15630 [Pseudonocardia sp. Cha107L01]|uniref:hypothetical protein n=1 Tax=Pseudonocardia sp. Cha107L01 TaxID=3457576 RepID=UPI00403EC22A